MKAIEAIQKVAEMKARQVNDSLTGELMLIKRRQEATEKFPKMWEYYQEKIADEARKGKSKVRVQLPVPYWDPMFSHYRNLLAEACSDGGYKFVVTKFFKEYGADRSDLYIVWGDLKQEFKPSDRAEEILPANAIHSAAQNKLPGRIFAVIMISLFLASVLYLWLVK